jgi:hypothetical protein
VQFTDHELMFMFDAAAQHAANPLFDDMPEVEEMYLKVAQKCQDELVARGYAWAGQTTYTV